MDLSDWFPDSGSDSDFDFDDHICHSDADIESPLTADFFLKLSSHGNRRRAVGGTEEPSEDEAPSQVASGNSAVQTLRDAALKVTAEMLPFEFVEIFSNHVKRVPDNIQLDIIRASFPQKKAIYSQYAHLSRKRPFFEKDYGSQSKWQVKEGKQIGTNRCRVRSCVALS